MPGEPNPLKRAGEAPRGFLPEEDRTFLDTQRAILEQTEGWEKMTPRQQTMILASLIVQMRAERGTDKWSHKGIRQFYSGPQILQSKDYLWRRGKYSQSQGIIAELYCHLSVDAVERESVPNDDTLNKKHIVQQVRHGYFDAKWEPLSDAEFLLEKMGDLDFPFIIFIGQKRKLPFHSCIALGSFEDDILIWEKINCEESFQLEKFSTVINSYCDATHFSVRPLENRASLIAKGWLSKEK